MRKFLYTMLVINIVLVPTSLLIGDAKAAGFFCLLSVINIVSLNFGKVIEDVETLLKKVSELFGGLKSF